MAHGNKKYNFEDLKKKGDTIIVNTANIYSLKNNLRLYSKEIGVTYKDTFVVEDKASGSVQVERVL